MNGEWISDHLIGIILTLFGLLCSAALAWCKKISSDISVIREENSKQGERLATIEAVMGRLNK